MRKPRLEAFSTSTLNHKPDDIDMAGVVPLQPKPSLPVANKVLFTAQSHPSNKQGSDLTEQESEKERLQERKIARNLAAVIHAALEMKAATNTSFRFPSALIDNLEETAYLVKKKHNRRITKNAILVAALTAYLWDFDQNGAESLLFKHLIEAEA